MSHMKITAGLGSANDYIRLAKAGADELFTGFVPLVWLERYSNITPLNRREVLLHDIQTGSMDEMRLLAHQISDYGVPVSITFNSICYAPEQYSMIAGILGDLAALGFRDWILADPALILYLKQQGINGRIHLSGEAGCFNPDAMRFFASMGVARWIFPRKILPEEMAACIAAIPGAEYEAFVLNEKCHYSGAFCSSLHCDELDHICHVPFQPDGPDFRSHAEAETDPDTFGAGGCALCALPRLRHAGVTHLKLVGRGAHPDNMVRDIRLLRRALEMEDASPESLMHIITGRNCAKNCYYPTK